jgi:hypothetical protein
VSDCCTTSVYYEPPTLAPPDPWDYFPWLLVLPIILFALALIWLAYLTPAKATTPEKTLREDVDGVFKQLIQDANTFKRDEAVGPLTSAQQKISDIMRKHGK